MNTRSLLPPTLAKRKGFTLIELMIAVLVVGILATVAYPSYVEHIRKARRSAAQRALLSTAQVLERCYTGFNVYNNANCGAVDNDNNTQLAAGLTSTEGGYYTLSATALAATAFALQAAPAGAQWGDKCGSLTYNHVGQKGITGAVGGVTAADCW